VGDLVATALAPQSRNRSAGELLAQGVPAAEIPGRLGQAVESLETVPLLARAIEAAGLQAPITTALARLIDGSLPLEEWVALVRVSQPEPSQGVSRFAAWWRRLRARFRRDPARSRALLEAGRPRT
jgi:glycerol-3-phosphate dehydrogenase (NAD(P)+)